MKTFLSLIFALFIAAPALADDAAASGTTSAGDASSVTAAAPGAASAPVRKVSPGSAYGANTFAGMAVGALIGTAVGAIPYAINRQCQDPNSVIYGAVYGAVGGAVGLGLPLSAWEVASDRKGAGITVLYNTLGFAVTGGAIGAGAGMIGYRRKVDYDPRSAEDFTAAAAAGVCTGAGIGIFIGIADALYQGPGMKVPGKGIHANAGLLRFSSLHDDGRHVTALPNVTLLKAEF